MSDLRDGMATVFQSSDHNAEIEAETIRAMLESNGVEAFLNGLDVFPGAHDIAVMVREDQQERAAQLIAEAQEAGPAAAEEGERASEGR